MGKKAIYAGLGVGIVVIAAAVVGGIEYHRIQVQNAALAKQRTYNQYFSESKTAARKGNIYPALQDIDQAIALDKTPTAIQWKQFLAKLEPHTLLLLNGNPDYSLAANGGVPKKDTYGVEAISTSLPALKNFELSTTYSRANDIYGTLNFNGAGDELDYQDIVDSLPIGQKVYVQVINPEGKTDVFQAKVKTAPKGAIGYSGFYTGGRFGVNIELPHLKTAGIRYGWIPSHSPTDGDGRKFTDPLNPAVTVTAYGMNNATYSGLNSYVPPSAHITNSNLTIGIYPALEYTDVRSIDGVTAKDVSIVAGAPILNSMNEVDVTVPLNQVPKYQVLVNSIIDSFYPGNLTKSY